MHSGIITLSLLLSVSLSHSFNQNVFNFEIPRLAEKQAAKTKFSDIINNLVSRYHIQQNGKHSRKSELFNILMNGRKLKQFDFKDCGGFAAKIESVTLSPDPLAFPGNLIVSAKVQITEELSGPLMANISIEKDSEPFICNIFPSYCHRPDVCTDLAGINPCPPQLVKAGIPCKCPIKPNTYSLPLTSFQIDAAVFLAGNYHINAAVYSGGKKAACVDFDVSIIE